MRSQWLRSWRLGLSCVLAKLACSCWQISIQPVTVHKSCSWEQKGIFLCSIRNTCLHLLLYSVHRCIRFPTSPEESMLHQIIVHNAPLFLVPDFLQSSLIVVFAVTISNDPPTWPSCGKRSSQWFPIVGIFSVLWKVADQLQQHLLILQTLPHKDTEASSEWGLVLPSWCRWARCQRQVPASAAV